MYKYIYLSIFILITYSLCATTNNIDKKINININKLKQTNKQNKNTSIKIKSLAQEIQKEEDIYNDILYNLNKVSNSIFLNKLKLQKSKKDIQILNKQTIKLKNDISNEEEKLVNSISDKYSITLGKNLINKKSLTGIIEKEKYNLILDDVKDKILKSNLNYLKLSNDKRKNNIKKQKIENYISLQENKKKRYQILQKKQQISLEKIKLKHKKYQKELKSIINKQYTINKLLSNLNIVKQNKIKENEQTKLRLKKIRQREAKRKKEKEKKKKLLALKKAKKNSKSINKKAKSKKPQKIIVVDSKEIKFTAKKRFQDDIDLKVRNIGSTSKGIKISSYRGRKTIAPLKKYKIVKKFGKYYDSVYKIELFNESISLKSKIPNAKVHSVLKGKVVYAKHDAGELGNVVIVKHKGNLHTIYSQLSKIPSSLKVGQWIRKGYVVGRVNDTLVFQATKNSRYVNPIKLFK